MYIAIPTYSGLDPLKNIWLNTSLHADISMVITDRRKSATYANGLTRKQRVFEQWAEIEQLNEEHGDHFTILKVLSDILSDGSLDYTDEILKKI